jgi:flagellar assembly factor FliW
MYKSDKSIVTSNFKCPYIINVNSKLKLKYVLITFEMNEPPPLHTSSLSIL